MMGGAVSGSGGPALGRHNSAPQESGDARPGSSRGLMSEGIAAQTRELTEEARASGHKAPLRHAWASPPPGAAWGEAEWDAYWTLYERAQGLQGCAYSEAIHDKPGPDGRPPHRHRIYLGITERGTLVRDGWSYAKQEAVSRITEVDTGQALTKGKHNEHAARIARDLGREDVAAAMEVAGLMSGPPAIARLSPAQRAQQERTGITKADVARAAVEAWKASDGGQAFMAALRERGLRLAEGTKRDGVPVIVDAGGSTHGLRQMLGMAAREAGQPAPRQAAIAAFLAGTALPSLAEARADQHAAGAAPAEPAMPRAVPAHDHETAAPVAGAAAPVPGPTAPIPEPQAPILAAAAPAPLAMSAGGGGAGGGEGAAGPGAGGSGAIGTEHIDGPGEPPGPGASVQEVQRWREKFLAWEERKGNAARRQQAALAAENERNSRKGETTHAQAPAHSHPSPGTPGARPNLSALNSARSVRAALSAEGGHGGHGHAHPGRGPGHARDGTEGGGLPGGDVPPGGGGGKPPGRGDGAAGGDMRPAGGDGRQALRHRAALARAAAALGSIDTGPLLDRLDPGRAAARLLDTEDARIARGRALEPHPDPLDCDPDACARAARTAIWRPLHEARKALPAAMARARAASEGWRWWKPATWREHRKADTALAHAHAAVTAVMPSGDALDEAGELARRQAGAARDANTAWHEGMGQVLARRAALVAGIREALDGGDVEMRRVLLEEGVAAAMRHHAGREQDGGEYVHAWATSLREASGNVVALPTPL